MVPSPLCARRGGKPETFLRVLRGCEKVPPISHKLRPSMQRNKFFQEDLCSWLSANCLRGDVECWVFICTSWIIWKNRNAGVIGFVKMFK